MTSSGTYADLSNFSIAQVVDEAFRRIKIAPQDLTTEHTLSARISLTLLFADWANEGNHQFIIDLQESDLVVGDDSFTMPSGSIDVLDMVYRYNEQDIQIQPISRKDYLDINDKTSEGQPVCYFVDKTSIPPVVYLWPVPNVDDSQVVYNRLMQVEDVGAPTNTPGTTRMYIEALCAGLAARLAEKYADEAMERFMLDKAMIAYRRATNQDRDRAAYVMKPRLGRGYYGI